MALKKSWWQLLENDGFVINTLNTKKHNVNSFYNDRNKNEILRFNALQPSQEDTFTHPPKFPHLNAPFCC
jgi:hypothetical protein